MLDLLKLSLGVGKQDTYLVIPVSSSDMKFKRIESSEPIWNGIEIFLLFILSCFDWRDFRWEPDHLLRSQSRNLCWLDYLKSKRKDQIETYLMIDSLSLKKRFWKCQLRGFFYCNESRFWHADEFENSWINFDLDLFWSKHNPVELSTRSSLKFWFWFSLTVNLLS